MDSEIDEQDLLAEIAFAGWLRPSCLASQLDEEAEDVADHEDFCDASRSDHRCFRGVDEEDDAAVNYVDCCCVERWWEEDEEILADTVECVV